MNKKFGFTLAELLIVLGITGVIAALLIGATKTLMPDKTKVMYLKAYDALARDIKDLGSNSTLYPAVYEFNGSRLDTSKIPFVNNSQPLKPPFSSDARYSGDNKLCNVLAYTMHAEGNANCAATAYPATPSYTTRNGMRWWIVPQRYNIDVDNHTASYQTDIYVDVNSAKDSPNCMYGDNGCRNPDIFKFLLAADGTLVPADPQGQNYIKTRRVFTKRGAVEAGRNILDDLPDNLIDSEITPVREQCEGDLVWNGQACVAQEPQCEGDLVWNGSACVAVVPTCESGMIWDGSKCATPVPQCETGYSWNGSTCVENIPKCKLGYIWNGKVCVKTGDSVWDPICGSGSVWDGNACVGDGGMSRCGNGKYFNGSSCVSKSINYCGPGKIWNGTSCVGKTPNCGIGYTWDGNICVKNVEPNLY